MSRSNLPFRKNCEGYFFRGDTILAKKTSFGVAFPGGGIDSDENASDAIVRETYEETGAKVTNLKIIGRLQFVWDKDWAHTEKQKKRYAEFQGEDMTFFTGEIGNIDIASDMEDAWSGKLFIPVSEVLSILESKGDDEYSLKQLELVKTLFQNS